MILGCIKVLARGKPLSSIVSALELCFELLPWFLPVMDGGLEGALFMLFVITTEKQTRTDPCLGGFHTKEVARPGLRLTPKPLPFAFFLCHFNSQLGPQSPENGINYTVIMPWLICPVLCSSYDVPGTCGTQNVLGIWNNRRMNGSNKKQYCNAEGPKCPLKTTQSQRWFSWFSKDANSQPALLLASWSISLHPPSQFSSKF